VTTETLLKYVLDLILFDHLQAELKQGKSCSMIKINPELQ
jgi:hypothetical protein